MFPAIFRPAFTRAYTTASPFLNEFIQAAEKGPMQISIENKLTEAFNPSTLHIVNESHMHAHHAPMKDNTSKETHFRVTIVSEAFTGKSLMQRHRAIYKLLEPEIQSGLHALTLRTKTQAEIEKKA